MTAQSIKNHNPRRIISVVPSQTELLFDLGLRDEVIGITKFCIHPNEWFRTKTRIGGTKSLRIEQIHLLKPDLILANKEENTKEQIEDLQQRYPVYISDIKNIDDALGMIKTIGQLVDKNIEAEAIVTKIIHERSSTHIGSTSLKALYLIWQNPYMAAGINTFIHSMLNAAGFANCLSQNRYPCLTIEQITELHPEVILLSSEPYPFKQKHIHELATMLPNTIIKLVDGELFSWYGSRMSKSFEYFRALHAELN